jgi:TetR/AcrR family transcriptional regulator
MDNKSRIAQESLKLFTLRGYDGAGIREICELCGIEKPTLYYYFGNKEGILHHLLESRLPDLIRRLNTAARYQNDIGRSLEEITRLFFSFASSDPDYYKLLLSLHFAPEEGTSFRLVQPYFNEIHRVMENLFLEASRQHGNMANRQVHYSYSFTGLMNTYITLFLQKQLPMLDESLVYTVCRQFMYGIFT